MAFKDDELMANIFYYTREGYPHHTMLLIEKAKKRYPNDPLLMLHLGIALISEGALQDALKKFNDLKDKEEFVIAALISIAHIHRKLPEIDQEVVRECEAKIRELRRHVSEKALYYAALVLFYFGRHDKAGEYVEKSLKGNLLFKEALCLNGWIDLSGSDEGLQKKAVRFFEESTNDEESMAIECLMGKIRYFQKFKAIGSALDTVNIVIVNFPNYVPALIEKMRLQLMNQDWEQMIDTVQRCLTADSTCIEALKYKLLYLLCYGGKHTEALEGLEHLRVVLETSEPKSSHLFESVSRLFAVLCGRYPAILEKLINLAEQAVKLNPRNHTYTINLGRIVLLENRPREAIRYFRNALNLCETSISGLEAVVQCHLALDNLQEATTQLEFLKELQPTIGKSAEVNYMAAVLGRKHGTSVSKILTHLDEAVEIHLSKLGNLELGPQYYETLNPDFLVQIVSEYLFHAPSQPPATLSLNHSGLIEKSTYKRSNDSILLRCLRVLEPLTSACPGFQRATYLMAYVRYLLGDMVSAINHVKSCLEMNSSLVEGYILLAQIYLYQSNLKMAEQALETGLSNNFEVRNHPLYQLVRARLLSKQGSAKIAVQILKQTINTLKNPNHSSRIQSNKLNTINEGFSGYGCTEMSAGDRLSIYLELAEAHRILDEQHEATKVLQDAQLAFAGSPEAGRVTIAMADLALVQGDHENALSTLQLINAEHPYYVLARQHMATIYLHHRKDKKLYAACYREVAETLGTPDAKMLLGDAYMTIQEPERAIEVYESVLRKNPSDLRVASKMGQALIKTHHYAKAVSYYEAAVKGGQTALRLDLADLLIKIKQYEKAKRILIPLVSENAAESECDDTKRSLELLYQVYLAEDAQPAKQIQLLNRLKQLRSKRLMKVQRLETNETIIEQKLAMADLYLQLASAYWAEARIQFGERGLVGREKERVKEEKTELIKTEISGDNAEVPKSTNSLELAIQQCQEAIQIAIGISGRTQSSIKRVIQMELDSSIDSMENKQCKQAALRMETKALVQLIQIRLYAADYIGCEQDILKLAQLEEDLEDLNPLGHDHITEPIATKQTSIMNCDEKYKDCSNPMINGPAGSLQSLPEIPPAALLMGDLMFAKGDFESACKHYEIVVNKYPLDYKLLFRFIDALRRAGCLGRVKDCLTKAKNVDPHGDVSPGLNFCRGFYHSITGDTALALQHFNRSRKDGDFAEESIYRMVEICIYPDNHIPGSDCIDYPTLNTCNSNGQNGQSSTGPNGGLASNSGSLNSFDKSAKSISVGYDTAEQLLKDLKVIKSKKRYRFISTLVLLITRSKSKVEEALDMFAQMSQEDPDSGSAIYGAAACYIVLKQTQKARNQLKRLAKVPWNFQDAEQLEKAWLLLADIYIQSGKTELSQELLKRCLQCNRSCTKASEYFGFIMEKEQNFVEASRYYEQAWVNSNRQNPVVGYKLAYNYLKIKRLIEAIEVCLRVLTVFPNYPKIQKEILDKARLGLRT